MTTSPAETDLPPARGRRRSTALGLVLRTIKALPGPLRERALNGVTGGMGTDIPPFPDVLRMLEVARGLPNGRGWQADLLLDRPDLAAVRVRDISDDSAGRVRGRLYLPPAGTPSARAALVWVHGGAFVLGGLDQEEAHWPAMELAAAGTPVLSVDYRLCLNGTRFPEPVDDVLSSWDWAQRNASELGVAADQLHLGGASAGGCLVASATLRLRDQGGPLPASLFLAYPVLQRQLPPATADMAVDISAATTTVDDLWFRQMFDNWAGSTPTDDPYVAPGLADPAGLPPVYVLTCGRDSLRRASEPFVERLRTAGVPVWQDVFRDSEHAPLDRPSTPDGQRAVKRLKTWLSGGVAAMGAAPIGS